MTILCTERIADTNELQVRLVELRGELAACVSEEPLRPLSGDFGLIGVRLVPTLPLCRGAGNPMSNVTGCGRVESCASSEIPTSLLSHRQHRCHRQANIGINGRGLGRGSAAFVTVRKIRQQKAVVKWLARQIQSTSR